MFQLPSLNLIDVSQTGLSGPIPIRAFQDSGPSICIFSSTQLCTPSDNHSTQMPCIGLQSLPFCTSLRSSMSTTSTVATLSTHTSTSTGITSTRSSTSTRILEEIPSSTYVHTYSSMRPTLYSLPTDVAVDPVVSSDSMTDFLSFFNFEWTLVLITLISACGVWMILFFSHQSRKKRNADGNLSSLLTYKTLSRQSFGTMGRSGHPITPRFESLDANRPCHNLQAEKLADYIISQNRNKKDFPVKTPYQKSREDELHLTDGDRIVLYKVFRDGWAEGVSKRTGGPAFFPLCCLGGSIISKVMHDPLIFGHLPFHPSYEIAMDPQPPRDFRSEFSSSSMEFSNQEIIGSFNPFKASALDQEDISEEDYEDFSVTGDAIINRYMPVSSQVSDYNEMDRSAHSYR